MAWPRKRPVSRMVTFPLWRDVEMKGTNSQFRRDVLPRLRVPAQSFRVKSAHCGRHHRYRRGAVVYQCPPLALFGHSAVAPRGALASSLYRCPTTTGSCGVVVAPIQPSVSAAPSRDGDTDRHAHLVLIAGASV